MAVISCKLTSPEFQKRKREVIALLKTKLLQRKELDNGFQYTFKGSDEILDNIVSFIKTERRCCDFFTFNLSIQDDSKNILLNITGPKAQKNLSI